MADPMALGERSKQIDLSKPYFKRTFTCQNNGHKSGVAEEAHLAQLSEDIEQRGIHYHSWP